MPTEKNRHLPGGVFVLLPIQQDKEGALSNRLSLNAHDAHSLAGTAQEFVSDALHRQLSADGARRELVRDTNGVDYGGRRFFRADYKAPMPNGSALYLSSIYTKFRGYYIGENVMAGSPGEMEQAANSLQHISFREDERDLQCVMNGDSSPSPVGVVGGILSSMPSARPNNSGKPIRVRVSQGVAIGLLVTRVQPQYPDDARQARIQGAVVLRTEIDKNGDVEDVSLVSGHPLLAPAAIEAVKQWKFKPYLLNGQPIGVETQVTVAFELSPY
jgi:TonB family protein